MQQQNDIVIWVLSGINGVLVVSTGFLIKGWMTSIKEDLKQQHNNHILLEQKYQSEVRVLSNEIGKRKGETELLKKDVEKLSSDTLNNFANIKLHLEYQKKSLEDLKSDAKERKVDIDKNFDKLFDLMNK